MKTAAGLGEGISVNHYWKAIAIKKYFYIMVTMLLMLANAAFAQEAPRPMAQLGPNLTQNGGFEEGAAHWNIASDTAIVVGDQAHSGGHSLYYQNEDSQKYRLFSQRFKLTPGQKLQLSAWIKVSNISGGGGSICLQSYDAQGKYLLGSFASGGSIKGTHDWQQSKTSYTVPQGAMSTEVIVYITKGGVGEVWFDDVELRTVTPPPFVSYLRYPNYRNTVMQGSRQPWQYQVQINVTADVKNVPVEITNTLMDNAGKVLWEKKDSVAASSPSIVISLEPPANLPTGKYTLSQHITDPHGKVYLADQQTINVVGKMPKVYIDRQGFTVVDGKRFFPMGLYLHAPGTTDENMERIAKGGFNTILTYDYGPGKDSDAYMERAAKHHLKVIYNSGKSTKYVEQMRDKPTLLAWYTSDEPRMSDLPALRTAYQNIQRDDVNHPIFIVQDKTEMMAKHFDNTDILGADPYPVGSANLTKTSRNTRIAVDAARGARGVWIVTQLMNWANYPYKTSGHWPTLDEMRNQSYQAIINGAKGLLFYSYYNLMYPSSPYKQGPLDMAFFKERWALVTQMSEEINEVVPVVLEDKKTVLDVPKDTQIEVGAWQDGNQLLLLMANPYYEEKSITFKLPDGWTIGNANQGEIKSTFANGQATFKLPSVGSGVFRLMKR